jgi:uncharacterized protein YjaG (DUF416 family)
VLRYDEAAIVEALARLSPMLRVVFAAACAERLFPAYEDFCRRAGRGDRAALANALEQVWRHLLGDEMRADQVGLALSRCMALVPGEDEQPWVDEQPYAEDAATAIAYTLGALASGDPQEAAWAARCASEAADYRVMYGLGVESEARVVAHPIVQRELSRQRRDLEEVVEAREASPALVARIRDRARSEASSFFDATS